MLNEAIAANDQTVPLWMLTEDCPGPWQTKTKPTCQNCGAPSNAPKAKPQVPEKIDWTHLNRNVSVEVFDLRYAVNALIDCVQYLMDKEKE
jgi:hypothetical protein